MCYTLGLVLMIIGFLIVIICGIIITLKMLNDK